MPPTITMMMDSTVEKTGRSIKVRFQVTADFRSLLAPRNDRFDFHAVLELVVSLHDDVLA